MYTEKQLRDELYQKVSQQYYVKMPLLLQTAKKEISLEEFEKKVRENSRARTPEDLEKQVFGAVTEVKAILEKINASGGIEISPVNYIRELRKQAKQSAPSKEALNTILPYLDKHPDDIEAMETFGWVMYDFIKSYEGEPHRYKNALSFLNKHAHFCAEEIIEQNDGLHRLLTCYLLSFNRILKANPDFANVLFIDIMDFVGKKDFFLNTSDSEFRKTSRNLYRNLMGKLDENNQLYLFTSLGVDWITYEDYNFTEANSALGHYRQICPAEQILNRYAKLLIQQSPNKENLDRASSLINTMEFHNKKSGSKFEYVDYHLAKLYLFLGNKSAALKKALQFISAKKKDGYAWKLLADCSEGDNRLAFLCAALLCGSKEEMKVQIQRELIPLFIEHRLYKSACFEVEMFEKTYACNKNWKMPKELIASWKTSEWYQTNISAGNREPLKVYAEKAINILASNLPTIQIFVYFINKEKGAVSFLHKERTYKNGYFYIDASKLSNIKSNCVYTAKIEQNQKLPDLYNVYDLCQDSTARAPFIREDHGIIRTSQSGGFAFVSSDSLMHGDTYIPAKLVEQYRLEDKLKIRYEKVMSWDRKKDQVSWTMTRLISEEGNVYGQESK